MDIAWGIVIVVLALLAWGGQALSWFAPQFAEQLGLMEAEDSVEHTYFADIRGEALWDTLTLWTLLVAGILLIVGNPAWAYFGLVGGGMYIYFAGRGICTRRAMQRRGYRIGAPKSVSQAYLFLAIWGIAGLITTIAAVVALQTS